MNIAVLGALLACLAFALAGPRLAHGLPPAMAVRLLVPAAVMAAGAGVFVLGTVTFALLGQLAEVAEFGTWSPHTLHLLDPIPPAASLLAGALLVPLAGWTLLTQTRTVWALWATHRAFRHLDPPVGSPVVVLPSDDLDAFTTPGWAGRIVVTSGLLDALDSDGRQVLLAHEQSHRRHRHIWWTLAADLGAAVNPLLRPTAAAIRHATERWADEDAAFGRDRRLVATTIAHVALLRAHRPGIAPTVAAAATGGEVTQRVTALLRPAPRLRGRYLATAGVFAVLAAAVVSGTIAVERTGEALFEHAKQPAPTVEHPATPHR